MRLWWSPKSLPVLRRQLRLEHFSLRTSQLVRDRWHSSCVADGTYRPKVRL